MTDQQNFNQNPQQPSGTSSGQTPPYPTSVNSQSTSGLAIAGFVLGIVAIGGSFLPIINNASFFLGLLGLVLAIAGLVGINKGKAKGKGLAIAGIVLGIVSIVVVLVTQAMFSAALSSIGAGRSSASTAVSASAGAASAASASAESAPAKYAVSIDGAEVRADYQGSPAIVVTFSWQNNSDDAQSFASAVYPKCFQNGVQLDNAIVTDGIDNGSYMAEVKPGSGTAVQMAYKLTDESPVDVEVSELFSLSNDVLAQATFNVA